MEQPVILCVENDERTRATIKKELSPLYKLLYFATNGEEALCFINELQPDIVYAGNDIPMMSGAQLIETINALGPSHIKTVINSPYSDEEGHIGIANLCLAGPLDCDKLIHTIGSLTGRIHQTPINCWEYNKCGKGPSAELPCSSALAVQYDGTNCGEAAGRYCWGMMENSCERCTLQDRFKGFSCEICEFHHLVQYEEGFCLLQ